MKSVRMPADRSMLQEFWSLLYDAQHAHDTVSRNVSLLRAWGVVHYAICGSANCELCRTPVRLAIPVTSERLHGEAGRHACLCTNCTFKELESARRIVLQVGQARVEYSPERVLAS